MAISVTSVNANQTCCRGARLAGEMQSQTSGKDRLEDLFNGSGEKNDDRSGRRFLE